MTAQTILSRRERFGGQPAQARQVVASETDARLGEIVDGTVLRDAMAAFLFRFDERLGVPGQG